jgi:hypothetical protein
VNVKTQEIINCECGVVLPDPPAETCLQHEGWSENNVVYFDCACGRDYVIGKYSTTIKANSLRILERLERLENYIKGQLAYGRVSDELDEIRSRLSRLER